MRYVFRLPDVGEGIHEAEIVAYQVNVGDEVRADQEIVKVETDKAVVALPAPADGRILEIPAKPGDVLEVGDPVIVIETEKEMKTEEGAVPGKAVAETEAPPVVIRKEGVGEKAEPPGRVLATPHTRHLARELGVDIKTIKGSGSRGRVTDEDVRNAVKTAPPSQPKIPRAAAVEHEPSTLGFDFEKYGPTKREPLKGIRKRIAEVMVRSYSTIPHVSHADEVDVTELIDVVQKQKLLAEKRGIKLTLTAFISKAVVSALREFPEVNSSLDEESGDLVYKQYYHLGIATDTENGLMVPVVKDADKKTIMQIAEEIQNLAERAKSREIDLEELRGGTFSITNIGSIGGIHATPIIQHPQVAILGVMRAKKRPVVREDQIVIRSIMPLVISFDHRILDGAVTGRFMNHIIKLLEDPMRMLVEVI
ncbi:MAG: dihydrolipoamide acetyltransferase family protein [candidate division KSB1 bacterium]|jgi:pyruvate dehydrogenase E2 component (dihydrolipoamide acetyltransferase)|nr:dihydrolipoamide acetyltransferase family protein [candidate division KSB1 bacterium]